MADALPGELWSTIEPLLRSALDGETRTREIWTAGAATLRDGRRRAAARWRAAASTPLSPREVAAALRWCSTSPRAGSAELLAPRRRASFEETFERLERRRSGRACSTRDGRWLLVNRALCDITGYTSEELIGKRFDGIVHPDDVHNDSEQRRRLLAGEIPAFQVEKRYFDAAGETVSAILSMSLVRDRDGAPLHYIAQLQDVSERRRLEENLRGLGDHDPLTGLRNRRLFEHDLKLQVARCRRYGEVAGLMVIDLDALPRASTSATASRSGDEALEAVARALTRRLQRNRPGRAPRRRPSSRCCCPTSTRRALAVVADGLARVRRRLRVDVGDDVLHPSASIGFALVDEHVDSAEQALDAGRSRDARAARRARARQRAERARWTRAPRSRMPAQRPGPLRCGEYAQRDAAQRASRGHRPRIELVSARRVHGRRGLVEAHG